MDKREQEKIKVALKNSISFLLLIIFDLFILFLSNKIGFYLRKILPDTITIKLLDPTIQEYSGLFSPIWLPFIFFGVFLYEGLYTRRLPYWEEMLRLLKSSIISFILVLATISIGRLEVTISRLLIIFTVTIFSVLIVFTRFFAKRLLAFIGVWEEYIVLFSDSKEKMEKTERIINAERNLGYKVKERVLISFDKDYIADIVKKVEEIANKGDVNVALVSLLTNAEAMNNIIGILQKYFPRVIFVPPYTEIPIIISDTNFLFDYLLFTLEVRNNLRNPLNIFVKRVIDIIASLVGIIIASPIMLIIAIAIKLDSPGPILFKHRRVGYKGKEFFAYKFRTMYVDAEERLKELLKDPKIREEWEKYRKIKDDPRVTRVGKFLRKFSLDELPQLFNILLGQMSLVGPRPVTREEWEKYFKGGPGEIILETKPGLTGLWQVSGRSDVSYEERIFLESWYARNWYIWLDIIIILKTIKIVLSREGAY